MSDLDEVARLRRMNEVLKGAYFRHAARACVLARALTAYRLERGGEWEQGRCQAFRLEAFRELMDHGYGETYACVREFRGYVDGVACCGDCSELLGASAEPGDPQEGALTDAERNPSARDGSWPFGGGE